MDPSKDGPSACPAGGSPAVIHYSQMQTKVEHFVQKADNDADE